MKRLVVAGVLVGLMGSGLWMASAWSAQATSVMISDEDPNDGGSVGPEYMLAGVTRPMWLTDEDPNDPNDPNGPEVSGAE